MDKKKTLFAGAVVAIAVLTSAASCDSKFSEPFKDAPRSGVDNEAPMNVVDGADGFSNIGWKCVGKDGAYHGDHAYASIFVVPNDPNCLPGASVR